VVVIFGGAPPGGILLEPDHLLHQAGAAAPAEGARPRHPGQPPSNILPFAARGENRKKKKKIARRDGSWRCLASPGARAGIGRGRPHELPRATANRGARQAEKRLSFALGETNLHDALPGPGVADAASNQHHAVGRYPARRGEAIGRGRSPRSGFEMCGGRGNAPRMRRAGRRPRGPFDGRGRPGEGADTSSASAPADRRRTGGTMRAALFQLDRFVAPMVRRSDDRLATRRPSSLEGFLVCAIAFAARASLPTDDGSISREPRGGNRSLPVPGKVNRPTSKPTPPPTRLDFARAAPAAGRRKEMGRDWRPPGARRGTSCTAFALEQGSPVAFSAGRADRTSRIG